MERHPTLNQVITMSYEGFVARWELDDPVRLLNCVEIEARVRERPEQSLMTPMVASGSIPFVSTPHRPVLPYQIPIKPAVTSESTQSATPGLSIPPRNISRGSAMSWD